MPELNAARAFRSFDDDGLRSAATPYLARFNDGARSHEDALYRVATESAAADERATALFRRCRVERRRPR
jgi:hypothetical protein